MTRLRRTAASSYPALVKDLSSLLETARRSSARAVNALMTATYWEIGRRIIEFEQRGAKRAEYGGAAGEAVGRSHSAIRPGLFASQLAAFSGVLSPVPAEADSLDSVERIAL